MAWQYVVHRMCDGSECFDVLCGASGIVCSTRKDRDVTCRKCLAKMKKGGKV